MNNLKIAIVQLGRIGDLVLITPAFRLIKEKYPQSKLYLIAGRRNYDIALNNPYLDEIIIFNKKILPLFKFLFRIKFNNFDYWIDPKDHYSTESRLLASFINARNKIGYNKPNKKRIFNIDIPKTNQIIHHTLIGINALTPIGIQIPNQIPTPELYFANNEIFSSNVNELLKLNEYIFLNISASMPHKKWSSDNWCKFLAETEIFQKYNIIINYTENEFDMANYIKNKFPKLHYHNARSIRDVMKLIAESKLVITPDTAIVHIASAFKKPIFALYSGLDDFYEKFKPTTQIFKTVRAKNGDNGISSINPEKAINEFIEFFRLF